MKYQRITCIIFILLCIQSCTFYVQLFETKSDIPVKNELYVFENDTVQITYMFFAENGLMSFSIYNKTNSVFYIDWKKSSFIINSKSLKYWNDGENNNSAGIYHVYGYNPDTNNTSRQMYGFESFVATKHEKISFIPPKTNYYRADFFILPQKCYILKDFQSETDTVVLKKLGKESVKAFKTIYSSYSAGNSPLVFRNFLTFSFREDFKKEFSVDNKFYVNKVKVIPQKYYYSDADTKLRKYYSRNERFFFIDLPVNVTKYYRKVFHSIK